ncbi:hypothetical protein FACS1894151_05450 [Spirochaetia bacterium]|nr:hypothetical protein FACS1894151_05450 [Spirochaetia bacterium]
MDVGTYRPLSAGMQRRTASFSEMSGSSDWVDLICISINILNDLINSYISAINIGNLAILNENGELL